jgi:hypothetical protein
MAIPDDTCAACCTCASLVRIEYKAASASRTKPDFCGYKVRCGTSGAYRYFLRNTITRQCLKDIGTCAGGTGILYNVGGGIGDVCCTTGSAWPCYPATDCTSDSTTLTFKGYGTSEADLFPTQTVDDWSLDTCDTVRTVTDATYVCDVSGYGHTAVNVYSNEISEAAAQQSTSGLITQTLADIPAYGSTWSVAAGASQPTGFRNVSPDETTCTLRRSIYRLRFKIPNTGNRKCGRVTWIERFVPEGGTFISSTEIVSPGVLRSPVSLAAPPAGGTQARAVAIMGTGSPITVAGIRVMNPGRGYTSPPPVTIFEGIYDPTGWTAAIDSAGRVTGVAGGSGGTDSSYIGYGTGGVSAIISKVDVQGGATEATISGPSNLTTIPAITFSSLLAGMTAPILRGHMGVETLRCAKWDGVTPGDYDPTDPATWPLLTIDSPGYFELGVPTADGTTTLEDFRFLCDCADCP